MTLTAAMKAWAVEHCGVKADATDDEFRAAIGTALATGKLTPAEYTKLSEIPEAKEASRFSQQLAELTSTVAKLAETVAVKETPAPAKETPEAKETEVEETKETSAPEKKTPPVSKRISTLEKMFSRSDSGAYDDDGEKTFEVRVKEAADLYDQSRKTLTYPMEAKGGRPHSLAGRPVFDFNDHGRPVQESSDLDKAVAGAYCQLLAATAQRGNSRAFGFQALPQHSKELLCYAMQKMEWSGSSDGSNYSDINNRKLTELEQKQLIDDATSGGLEAAPIVFDDMVIQPPLLYGELFPLVNRVPIPRGRRIEGVSTGTVTGSWGGVDDTAITLFTTTSYVSAFDTTIYRWEGAIYIGLDFLSDTPIDFGAHISAQYGERLLEDLDDVIATGNGTTQPEGVMNCGATAVAWGGSTSIGNYESLRFGVAKAEHKSAAASAVFCGNETSYQRVRALPVGASDARRLFGMDHFNTSGGGYTFGGAMYKINESLANTQVFYAILNKYRMYVRRGLTMRTSTEGDTLIRGNEMLMVATARYGGQMERAAAASLTTTAPS